MNRFLRLSSQIKNGVNENLYIQKTFSSSTPVINKKYGNINFSTFSNLSEKNVSSPLYRSPTTTASKTKNSMIPNTNDIPPSPPGVETAALWKDDLDIVTNKNGCIVVTLNRPKSLNSLSLDMVATLSEYITQLECDDRCKSILVVGSGNKAFCAGGDVSRASKEGLSFVQKFFSLEYLMNKNISVFKKPYVSIWDGIVMGGGVGISIHGNFRVTTPKAVFAMPETTIGFIPDVGGSYFLPRITHPGLGLYLGLTGTRLNGGDLVKHGLATHGIASEDVILLKEKLETMNYNEATTHEELTEMVDKTIRSFEKKKSFDVTPLLSEDTLNQISNFFGDYSNTTLKEVVQRLEKEKDNIFCSKTLSQLKSKCPLSLSVWWKQHQKGLKMSLQDCLRMEFLLAQFFCVFDNNFKEGVRALLIDKDNKPVWTPKSIEEIDEDTIEGMFDNSNKLECLDSFIPLNN